MKGQGQSDIISLNFMPLEVSYFLLIKNINQVNRREIIIKRLKENKKVEIDDLSEELNVSKMTIRRDLKYLESIGVANLISRGAIASVVSNIEKVDDTLNTRTLKNIKEKKMIAKCASEYVKDGDVIFLDASTTVYEMCPYLENKKITILTNSIRIAQYFNLTEDIMVILTGGVLRFGTLSLIGSDSEETIGKYNTNKVFISSRAVSISNGVTDVNIFEINTKKIAIQNTKEVILLMDSSKINNVSLQKVCEIEEISKLITNKDEKTKKTIESIAKLGIKVLQI